MSIEESVAPSESGLDVETLARGLYETMSRQYGDRYADTYPAVAWDELGPGSADAWREDATTLAARLSPAMNTHELRDFAEDVAQQFGYWVAGKTGGLTAGGLSTLERAFSILGWDDPHPVPERRCDEPDCMKAGTMGWPTRPGGTGENGGYRRTCFDHSDIGRARLRQP